MITIPSEFELLPFIEMNDIFAAQTNDNISDKYASTVRVFDHNVIAGGTAATDADASTVGEYTVTYTVTLDRNAYNTAVDAIIDPQPVNDDAILETLNNSTYSDTYNALKNGKNVTDTAVARGLQKTLIDMGADIVPDGQAGPATMAAFADICTANNINAETVTAGAYLTLLEHLIADKEAAALKPVAEGTVIDNPQYAVVNKTVTVISSEDYAVMLEAKVITEVTAGIAVPAETAEEHASALLNGDPDETQLILIRAYKNRIPASVFITKTDAEAKPETQPQIPSPESAPARQPQYIPQPEIVPIETQPEEQPVEPQPETDPAGTVPTDAVPTESVPTESVPAETDPAQTAPAETAPTDAVPAENAVETISVEAIEPQPLETQAELQSAAETTEQ